MFNGKVRCSFVGELIVPNFLHLRQCVGEIDPKCLKLAILTVLNELWTLSGKKFAVL